MLEDHCNNNLLCSSAGCRCTCMTCNPQAAFASTQPKPKQIMIPDEDSSPVRDEHHLHEDAASVIVAKMPTVLIAGV